MSTGIASQIITLEPEAVLDDQKDVDSESFVYQDVVDSPHDLVDPEEPEDKENSALEDIEGGEECCKSYHVSRATTNASWKGSAGSCASAIYF